MGGVNNMFKKNWVRGGYNRGYNGGGEGEYNVGCGMVREGGYNGGEGVIMWGGYNMFKKNLGVGVRGGNNVGWGGIMWVGYNMLKNGGGMGEQKGCSDQCRPSRRILNTTNIIDPSNQLSCTAYMIRNKDKPVKCQLPLPTKHELYVSGRGTIDKTARGIARRQGFE
ncbi:hypothetical protein DPMN_119883 [Dreissena polymorpha]|uniref:Uncharacterized protein n=1 Tax=Dreissena polymorpha TaxID=45954 RepID=A0A9D4GN54_DREPO|nr:hypothetical protein DPMN_119883 [Dreissena polymorpha]